MSIKPKFICLILSVFFQAAWGRADQDRTAIEDTAHAFVLLKAIRTAEIERERLCREGERMYVEGPSTQAEKRRREERQQKYEEQNCSDEQKYRPTRLQLLCPLYSVTRKICDGVNEYENCMNNWSGNRYSLIDESDCKNR